MLARPFVLALGLGLALPASASAREAVHLRLEAPSCTTEEALRTELATLGGKVARPAAEPARSFDVRVAHTEGGYDARLVVTERNGERRERSTVQRSCAEATRSAALLVALALADAEATADDDDAAPPPAPMRAPATPPVSEPVSDLAAPWPAAAERPIVAAGRSKDSGGVALLGAFGGSPAVHDGTMALGGRVLGVARVYRGLRLGGTLGASREREDHTGAAALRTAEGWSTRAGAVVALGAPWDDSVLGIAAEAGISGGASSRKTMPRLDGSGGASLDCRIDDAAPGGMGCFDGSRSAARQVSVIGPYAAGSLALQIPLSAPVRPMTAFTVLARGDERENVQVMVNWEVGLVWQAW
ncbi:MAG: hypothetical protein U0270_11015 [Labilithrix sp.]